MARMRFAHECLAEIKEVDPLTSVTLNYIRSLRGIVPGRYIGRRFLYNLDALIEHIAGEKTEPESELGVIRRVPERLTLSSNGGARRG